MDNRIQVFVFPTGDNGYCDEPEQAILAARTMMNDARDHGYQAKLTASFHLDGKCIHADVPYSALYLAEQTLRYALAGPRP